MLSLSKRALLLACTVAPLTGCPYSDDIPDGHAPASHGAPEIGYVPRPVGCPPGLRSSSLPKLPMPWTGGPELHLGVSSSLAGFALDYDVVPLAIANHVRIDFVYDEAVSPQPFLFESACPASLPASAWSGHGATNDVVLARVELGAAHETRRFAWISFPVGSHTYTLDVSAIPDANRTGSFFAIYAPSWGARRIALVPVELGPGVDTLTVSGLPDGEGHIAVVRSPLPRRFGTTSAYTTFSGFSTLWATAVELWAGAPVEVAEAGVVPLTLYRGADEAAGSGRLRVSDPLGDDRAIPWNPTHRVRFITVGPETSDGEVLLACDGVTTAALPFAARATISLDGAEVELGRGELAPLDPSCTGAAATARAHIRIVGETSVGFLVLRNP